MRFVLGARVASWTRQYQRSRQRSHTTHATTTPPTPTLQSPTTMNAEELLECAPRLGDSHRAYVIFNNGDRGVIVPPGASGNKINVRACDAAGRQSGPVKHILAKDLRLEPLPAPPAPLRLAPWCVNCGSPAMMNAARADRVSVVCRVLNARGRRTGPSAGGCRRWRLGRSTRGRRIVAIE